MTAAILPSRGNRLRVAAWSAAALALLAPAVAMRFTGEVNWGGEDFLAAAAMILVTGSLVELSLRVFRRPATRLAAAGALASAFLLVWAQLAVGLLD